MKTLTIFLSHSSRDKTFVRRLSSDLKAHGFDTWFDEERIPLGGSITEEIERGLEKSDVTLLFLSEYALQSKWVRNEWQSRFFEQMLLSRIVVIPVRLDNCEIPPLLKDKRRLDFIEGKYEDGLSILLANLNVIRQQKSDDVNIFLPKPSKGILSLTKDLLDDLESEYISLPSHRRLDIIDSLKKLPRSGKLLAPHRGYDSLNDLG